MGRSMKKQTKIEERAVQNKNDILDCLCSKFAPSWQVRESIKILMDKKIIPCNVQLRVLVDVKYKELIQAGKSRKKATEEIELFYDIPETTVRNWVDRFRF